jgi:two-component system, cell cycle response regulator DivK
VTHSNGKRTILLVEDNGDGQVIMKACLEHAGFRVLLAGDGAQSVAIARDSAPDVILMDLGLPVLDGWAAATEIRTDVATRDIPIIALTALAMPRDEQRAREIGMQGYLTKPAALTDILAAIERVLPG